MRLVGTIDEERHARIFADYLLAIEIRARVDTSDSRYEVWVYDEDHVSRGAEELAAFVQNPADPKYADARPAAAKRRADEERAEREYRKNVIDARTYWRNPYRRAPVTAVLTGIAIAVFLATDFAGRGEDVVHGLQIASRSYDNEGQSWGLRDVREGQVWRLATPALLHFGIHHLVFNLWCLVSIGVAIESRRRSLTFGTLVLVSAIVSNLAQFYHTGPHFGGLSGVNYALFGYALMFSWQAPELGIRLSQSSILIFAAWTVACLTGMVDNIANMAHLVGLIVGILAGAAALELRRFQRRS